LSDHYAKIRQYRDTYITNVSHNHLKLNQFHDELFQLVLKTALQQTIDQFGPLPSPFCFFVTGSAGRFEQSIWSDQDNGIIYLQQTSYAKAYFLQLGKEISIGLNDAGYSYCDGAVMASNPLWCQSLEDWEQQIDNWLEEASWESIRYLLIFLDARSVYGESSYVEMLKKQIYQEAKKGPLLHRALQNTMFLKKGVNVLGSFLTDTHGPHSGSLNLKEVGFLPYINAARLLAIKEARPETSTLLRLESISDKLLSEKVKQLYKEQFQKLLNYRLLLCPQTNYESGHYLPVSGLSKGQAKELKEILKNGTAFFHAVRRLIEKENSYGN